MVTKATKPRYAAFLFVPGREWLQFGAGHTSIKAAQEHLIEHMTSNPTWQAALIVEVKSYGSKAGLVAWT